MGIRCVQRETYHSVVLKLGLAQRRSVASNDDELGLSVAEGLQGGLVAEGDFARLHHKRQARVDGVTSRGSARCRHGWRLCLGDVRVSLSLLGCHRELRKLFFGVPVVLMPPAVVLIEKFELQPQKFACGRAR